MAGSSNSSKNKCKRSHEEIDRLADLSDDLLLRVLSFLDTKSAFRTTPVSKRWRSLWKDVTVLRFRRESFPGMSSFTKHLYDFLSHRSNSAPVESIAIDFPWECHGCSAISSFSTCPSVGTSRSNWDGLLLPSLAMVTTNLSRLSSWREFFLEAVVSLLWASNCFKHWSCVVAICPQAMILLPISLV
ncbi:unnamed protein product [Linum tenue]|uniref:F-box domain-containing protein n=1 Tax=Linum tenue TaxID=586396 RepID=A0AAV0NYD3_9ROSI|nr:unnamed protein product [Linum tenue]